MSEGNPYTDRAELERSARDEAEGLNSDWGSGTGPHYVCEVSRWALQLLAERRELSAALREACDVLYALERKGGQVFSKAFVDRLAKALPSGILEGRKG